MSGKDPMMQSSKATRRFLAVCALLGLLASSVLTAARPAAHARSSVTLVVWWSNWGTDFDKLMQKATDIDFHKAHPDVTVKWTFYTNLQQKLLTAIAAGSPPDMTYINSTQSQAWAQKGVLTPLDSYFSTAGLKESDFVPPRSRRISTRVTCTGC